MNGDAAPELALLDARNLIQLPGFQDMDPQRKELLRSKFQHILDRPTSIRLVQGSHLDELQFRVSSGGKQNAHRQALPFKQRSIAKKVTVEFDVATLYFKEMMKPSAIAKKLRLSPEKVYRIVELIKRNANRVFDRLREGADPKESMDQQVQFDPQTQKVFDGIAEKVYTRRREVKGNQKLTKAKNPELLSEMESFFMQHGIYLHSSQQLQSHLLQKLGPDKVPSSLTIRKLMKEKFNLHYKRLQKASTKYRDPQYNEKRMWVSRIMAQFFKEEVIIICIDESNFKFDSLPSRQWQFDYGSLDPISTKPKQTSTSMKSRRDVNLLYRTDDEINYGQYLKQINHAQQPLAWQISELHSHQNLAQQFSDKTLELTTKTNQEVKGIVAEANPNQAEQDMPNAQTSQTK